MIHRALSLTVQVIDSEKGKTIIFSCVPNTELTNLQCIYSSKFMITLAVHLKLLDHKKKYIDLNEIRRFVVKRELRRWENMDKKGHYVLYACMKLLEKT